MADKEIALNVKYKVGAKKEKKNMARKILCDTKRPSIKIEESQKMDRVCPWAFRVSRNSLPTHIFQHG